MQKNVGGNPRDNAGLQVFAYNDDDDDDDTE